MALDSYAFVMPNFIYLFGGMRGAAMQLLFERKQFFGSFTLVPFRVRKRTLFTLWAKAELTDEENELVRRYDLREAALVVGDFAEDFRKSIRIGFFSGFVALFFTNFFMSAPQMLFFSSVVAILVTLYYYNEIREQIYVKDILRGRKFRCDSVIGLVKKEAYLQRISNYLRQVLETAKHWDSREIIEVAPLSRDEAKAEVLRAA